MSTSEDLRLRIEQARELQEGGFRKIEHLTHEIAEAEERQRLRRELDSINRTVQTNNEIINSKCLWRDWIDGDLVGPNGFFDRGMRFPVYDKRDEEANDSTVNVAEQVRKSEYLWKVQGMSWLENALNQNLEDCVYSPTFVVGKTRLDLIYTPMHGKVELVDVPGKEQIGSLAIRHLAEDEGIILRYKIFIKAADGQFVQWGDEGQESHPDDFDCKAFGPDVQPAPASGVSPKRPVGIFGLSHRDLLQSEWVVDDTLVVKVQVEVMEGSSLEAHTQTCKIGIPAPDISSNMFTLLEEAKGTDITFLVDGQQIMAHSQILSARSEVLDRVLNGGLKESLSKIVEIKDADVVAFKAFLHFLYTDDFDRVEAMIKLKIKEVADEASEGKTTVCNSQNARAVMLQDILAVSHKYQVQRLRLWCESQLCQFICKDEVCEILCQAHLYGAKELENSCLRFIKRNAEAVIPTSGFGCLSIERPDVLLKINLFLADLPESHASQAMIALKECSKKRYAQAADLAECAASGKFQRTNLYLKGFAFGRHWTR